MSRSHRSGIALDTDEIVSVGRYRAPSGAWVDLSQDIETARAGARLVPSDEVRRLGESAGHHKLACTLTNRSTLAAISDAASQGLSVVALVFASARNPGGGYRAGSEAQEESLARSSALVATQMVHATFYKDNKALKSPLYNDAMIFSPNVPVFRDDYGVLLEAPHVASFITGAAPNAGELCTRDEHSRLESLLSRRMRAVVALAVEAGMQKLVLGAWGCGVFRNDPEVVARLWAETLSSAPGSALSEGVEMAVYDPSRKGTTWQAFDAVFGRQVPPPVKSIR